MQIKVTVKSGVMWEVETSEPAVVLIVDTEEKTVRTFEATAQIPTLLARQRV
jgi:hypothetical protein